MIILIYVNISMIFFTYIGPNLAKRIPKVFINPLSFTKEALKLTLFLSPVTETEINKIIRALKDSAKGHNDISSPFLKLALNSIVDPLTHICNMSLTEGVFPDTLKVANVIPLIKSEDPMFLTTTGLCHYCVYCQNSLRKLCMIDY